MALKEIDESTISQLQGLLEDPDPQVRRQAAEVLSHLGEERSSESLAATLGAESWLTSAGEPEQATQVQPSSDQRHDSVSPLLKALQDPVADVRLAAAEALGKVGDASVVPTLTQALQDSDSRVRAAAARAIGEVGVCDAQ